MIGAGTNEETRCSQQGVSSRTAASASSRGKSRTPSVMDESAATAAKNSSVVTLSVRLAPPAAAVTASAAPAAALSPALTTRSLLETIACASST